MASNGCDNTPQKLKSHILYAHLEILLLFSLLNLNSMELNSSNDSELLFVKKRDGIFGFQNFTHEFLNPRKRAFICNGNIISIEGAYGDSGPKPAPLYCLGNLIILCKILCRSLLRNNTPS